MGHNRFGLMAKTAEWQAVVGMLDGAEVDPQTLAGTVLAAARSRFHALRGEPAMAACIWMMAQITSVSRKPGFEEELRRLGLRSSPETTAIAFVADVGERLDARLATAPPIGHLGRIAALAVRQAFTEVLVPAQARLWHGSLEDVRLALAAQDTAVQFGRLGRSFIGHFMARAMLSFVDRELSQHIGSTFVFESVADGQRFLHLLDQHAHAAAEVTERFAGEWYTKHRWQTERNISMDSAQGFISRAMEKLASELSYEAAAA